MQRKAVFALTNAYSTTNNLKLLDLTKILEINEGVKCQAECKWKTMEEKRAIRAEFLRRQRERTIAQFGETYEAPFDRDEIGKIKRREAFWCVTGHGPFKTHLQRFDKNREVKCRFCGLVDETPAHLLHDCAHFETNLAREVAI